MKETLALSIRSTLFILYLLVLTEVIHIFVTILVTITNGFSTQEELIANAISTYNDISFQGMLALLLAVELFMVKIRLTKVEAPNKQESLAETFD